MNQALLLADLGNIAVTASAVLVTVSVAAYALRARNDRHGRWWRSPVGWHLMSYMAALAIVLDQGVIYMLATTGLLLRRVPPFRPDWFAWERVLSYLVLITFVFAWRLVLIIRPPQPPGGTSSNDAKEPLCSPGLPLSSSPSRSWSPAGTFSRGRRGCTR